MYNQDQAKSMAGICRTHEATKAVRIPEIPDALEQLKKEVDQLNDELNALAGRLSPVMRPEPACADGCEKSPSEPYGLLEPILRIRRSIGCANNQVRQITSTLMV